MNFTWMSWQLMALTLMLGALLGWNQEAPRGQGEGTIMMKESVTWLHLLRHTPFFTELNKQQLRWVIDHSKEWEVQPGTVIATVEVGQALADDMWILLDGGWQLETCGRLYPAGHSDPAKWYSALDVANPSRLVTTQKSFVMRIKRSDMNEMLRQGFAFNAHLQSGMEFYRAVFQSQPRCSSRTP